MTSQSKKMKLTHDRSDSKFFCDQCPREFISSQKLRNHKRSHIQVSNEEAPHVNLTTPDIVYQATSIQTDIGKHKQK
jgi:hypothetical protein